MTDNPFRQALARKEATGGWSPPGMQYEGDRTCLIGNLVRVSNLSDDIYYEAFEVLGDVCKAQIGNAIREGSIVKAHDRLPSDELDRIMEKAAVAWDERI